MAWKIKDPDSKLDYSFDWAAPVSATNPDGPWLASGETISTSTWTITPSGSLIVDPAHPTPSISGGVTTVWLAGGTDGTTYELTNRITTNQGRIEDQTRRIKVQQK